MTSGLPVPVAAFAEAADGMPARTVRGTFDDDTIVVWQAHSEAVANEALDLGRLGGPCWRNDRATRFRLSLPSLLSRNGWATRAGRERILGLRLARAGFERLLRQAVHAEPEALVYACAASWRLATRFSNVVVAWHPEVTPMGEPLVQETLRVTVRDAALLDLTSNIVLDLFDWTDWVKEHRRARSSVLPVPTFGVYPLPPADAARLAGRKA